MVHRRNMTLIMVGMLSLSLVAAACSKSPSKQDSTGTAASAEGNVNASGFPIVKEPVKLTFFASKSASNLGNWNEALVWQEYKKMTNIDVDFQLVPVEALAEKRNLAFAGGTLPDAFHTARLSSVDLANYGSQGLLIPLNSLIDKYAPNLKQIMSKYPEVKKALTMPDGKIYSFPTLQDPEFLSGIIGSQMWINQKFLDKLGMKEPETTEDLYNYLVAVKTKDPNGNGKADEAPFAAVGLTTIYDQLKGAWGLGNRGNMHPRVDVDPASNKLRFIPADPRHKEVLQYVNRLYKEGLFYKDPLTVNGNDVNAIYPQGIVGAAIGLNPNATISGVSGYAGVGALKGPRGDRLFSRARSFMILPGGFAISRSNKHPEATVRWIDYFYSDEGNKLFRLGVKDVSYVEKDGKVEWAEPLKKDQSQIGKYVTWAGGWYPSMDRQKYVLASENEPENLKVSEKIKPFYPKEVWPEFTYSNAEVAEFKALETDILKYVDEMNTKFITGDAPFSQWDSYVATLKKMGLDRYMSIYEAAYKRYQAN
ncbi:extracellular solute-binding protein [Paenibacillus hamazuiensis]|uniref:extracellular solute-binding protein n=1 Tax=Paenibacillus hamazuiensis TaxID=2936508 RepID=UPI00200F4DC6|nr:extracellular solute-binding protein [Paenibacillus hamazuiensis]